MSNRGDTNSLKERDKKRRQVFKPILDNPFTQANWPFIEPQVASDILDHLSIIFSSVKVYNSAKNADKRAHPPEVLSKITVGFNATNERLEQQAQGKLDGVLVKYIFVAKYDLNPAIITNHFPVLSYTASEGCGQKVKLVQLPRGATAQLSEMVGVAGTSVLGLAGGLAQAKALYEILDKVTDVEVPFLGQFKKPAIEFVRTSAPVKQTKKQQKQPQNDKQENKEQKQEKKQQEKPEKQKNKQQKPKSEKPKPDSERSVKAEKIGKTEKPATTQDGPSHKKQKR